MLRCSVQMNVNYQTIMMQPTIEKIEFLRRCSTTLRCNCIQPEGYLCMQVSRSLKVRVAIIV